VSEIVHEPGEDYVELTEEEVAAAARAFWLDEKCDRRDREHDEEEVIPYDCNP